MALQTIRLATYAMGTRFEIVLSGEDEPATRAAGEEALELIEECHQRFSVFERDSLVSHINRIAHRQPVRLDADTYGMFRVCKDVHEASGGAFDISIGPMMEACGFRGASEAPADRSETRPEMGSKWILLDDEHQTIEFADGKRLKLDLGGVAKGHALDLARRSLLDNGVASALLHGGTSGVVTIGVPIEDESSDGWRIAIRPPLGIANEVQAFPAVVLRNAALSVSAQHGQVVEGMGGEPIGHVLDPRGCSGVPAPGVLLTAVIGASACEADAWSTALLLTGSEDRCAIDFAETGMTGIVCRLDEADGDDRLTWQVIGPATGTWAACVQIPGLG